MLESVKIQNFKSYFDATLKLSPVTILIGANASGKSNAIEALKLLSWIAQGNSLGSIASMVQKQNHKIRGLVKELGFRGEEFFEFSCIGRNASWSQYTIRLGTTEDGELFVHREELSSSTESLPLFRARLFRGGEGAIQSEYNSFSDQGKKSYVILTNQMPAMIQFNNPSLIEGKHKVAKRKIPNAASECCNDLRSMVFIDPHPSEMRGYSFHNQKSLSEDGSNISSILYRLCKDPDSKKLIFEFVKSLPEQDIIDIDFIETGRGDVMVTLKESFGGEPRMCDATLLSDGTLRILAAAAAVLSAPKGSLVVIEEIDNGVHPSRAVHLLEKLAHVANSRDLRILISTHNPALLDGLPASEISKVTVSYRNSDTGASELIRMEDIQNSPVLVARGKLGQLMTDGTIDNFIKKNPGSEENRRRALSWIESFDSHESRES